METVQSNKGGKQLAVNLIANIIAFAVNAGISFFLTPVIIAKVGEDAYGFVTLGHNFVNYLTLVTIALNSMVSRFIAISIHKGNFEDAKKYFSSVIISNIVISLVLLVPITLIVAFLGSFLDISQALLPDVQLLWALLFLNFLITIITGAYGAAFFSANRVDIQSAGNIISYAVKAALLILLYTFFKAKVWYVGLTALICLLFTSLYSIFWSKRLFPDMRLDKKYFDFGHVKELLLSGMWNTVHNVGALAMTELDILMSNLFINANAMGIMSVAKTVPTLVSQFSSSLASVFLPQLTKAYSKGNTSDFLKEIRTAFRIILFFQCIIYGILFAYSKEFYLCWLPQNDCGLGQNEYILLTYVLSMITIGGCGVLAISMVLSYTLTVTNNLKVPSVVMVALGMLSCGITYLLVRFTNFGIYAIAGVSVFITTLRNVFFILPYSAKCIGVPWHTFFKDVLFNLVVIAASIGVCVAMKFLLIKTVSWLSLIIAVALTALLICVLSYFVILRKNERAMLRSKLMYAFSRKNQSKEDN